MAKMKIGWSFADRWMRTLHLYTGLFLIPWMIVYALSAFALNHRELFASHMEKNKPSWTPVSNTEFTPDDAFPTDPKEQGRAILQHLGLDGAHRFQGLPTAVPMTILRLSGGGLYRVQWRKRASRLVVERQQPFSIIRLTHFLHFKGGFAQPYLAYDVWAIIVDAVVASMVFWCLSGVYIWARRPKKRLLGGAVLAGGVALFLALVIVMSL